MGAALAAPDPASVHGRAAGSTSTVWADASTRSSGEAPSAHYSLLQMNLCLSGSADCFDDTRYPKVVDETVEVIEASKPSAVSINEACSGDMNRIAQRTRYHMRFAPIFFHGRRLSCTDPSGRGVYGNAVMTTEPIEHSTERTFAAQVGGQEHRGWICVQTIREVSVCTTHLSTPDSDVARATNARQCAEFAAVMASRNAHGPLLAAGDMNSHHWCTPSGVWTRTDSLAAQLPGIQHSYGSVEEFRLPHVEILPATFTDHDFILTGATLSAHVTGAKSLGKESSKHSNF
jgi:hypothetical protein